MSELLTGRLRERRTATSQDARQMNLRSVLRALALGEARTRADLARVTGLTPPTVSSLVGELVEDGLVVEAGLGVSAGGKPPTLLEVDLTARQVIAVDVSRRPAVGTLSDLAGHVLSRQAAGEPTVSGKALFEDVVDLIMGLAKGATEPIAGVGVGTPGLVTPEGLVVEAPNLGWRNLPLASEITDRTSLPAWVANDADTAALAEYGALSPDQDGLALVRIGAGVGLGLILGDRRHTGARAAAGEIGHLVVETDGMACTCGNRGCLETIVGIPSIIRRAAGTPGTAEHLPDDLDGLRGVIGDEAVGDALRYAGTYLGGVLAHLVAIVDVTEIVLSLEAGRADELLEAVSTALVGRLFPGLGTDVAVRLSALGDDIVLDGANALVLTGSLGMVRS